MRGKEDELEVQFGTSQGSKCDFRSNVGRQSSKLKIAKDKAGAICDL